MELTADDRKRLDEIFEAHEPEQLAARIFGYYHDADRAERTSRSQMYLHMGMLSGAVMRVVDGRSPARLFRRPGAGEKGTPAGTPRPIAADRRLKRAK